MMTGAEAYSFFLLLAKAARNGRSGPPAKPVVTLDAIFARDLHKLTPRELSEGDFAEAELPSATIERLSGDLLRGSHDVLEQLHGVEVKVANGPSFVLVDTGGLAVDSGTLLFCGKDGQAEGDLREAKLYDSRLKAVEHAATLPDSFIPWSVDPFGLASANAESSPDSAH